MKIKFLLVIVFILLNVFPIKLQAQVTIGSGIPPNLGSLLDLKEYTPNSSTGVNATKGLGMPRVSLVDPNSLSPTSIDTDAEKTSHVGLLVYNVSNTVKLCPGLHVWDGNTWLPLKPQIDSLSADLRQPNSYILATGSSIIDIPVSKAYAAWLNLTELGHIDLSNSSAVGGSTAISVELLWQTSNGVITSVALSNGDQGRNSSIRIVSGSVEGNGVVVMKIAGVVRWSWHIWVTNYDTTLPTNQNTLGETVFMSRNLGAISDNIGSIGNRGLYYQWGRKDPFAGTNGINSNVLAPIYNISGGVVTRSAAIENTMLATVQNPLGMVTFGWLGSNASEPEKSWGYGCTELKSIYDPCPEGWRVPHNLVWNGIDANNFIWDGTNLGRQSTSTVGWYSAAGHISGSSAFNVGTNAAYWSSVGPGSYPTANVFSFSSTIVFSPISNFGPRSNASSVRCVKDWMM